MEIRNELRYLLSVGLSQTQPDQIDWERFERTVSHIIIGTDNAITVHF